MDDKDTDRQPDPTNSDPAEKALATADGASAIDPALKLPEASVTGIAATGDGSHDDGVMEGEKAAAKDLPDSETGTPAGDGRPLAEKEGDPGLPDTETGAPARDGRPIGEEAAAAKPKRERKTKKAKAEKVEPKPAHTKLSEPPADEHPVDAMARIAEQAVRDFMADLQKDEPEEGADGLYAPHGHDRWAGRGYGIPDGIYALEGYGWAAQFKGGRMVNMARRDRWEGLGWNPLVLEV